MEHNTPILRSYTGYLCINVSPFKILLITCKVLNGLAPKYLANLLIL